jgi:hypothetical protein
VAQTVEGEPLSLQSCLRQQDLEFPVRPQAKTPLGAP